MEHKQSKKYELLEEDLRNKINTYSDKLWNPENIVRKPIETNSWFDINIGTNDLKKTNKSLDYDTDILNKVEYKSVKRILLPTPFQKSVLLSWMDSYIDMYNETLRLMKTNLFETKVERKRRNILLQRMKEFNTIEYNMELMKYESNEQKKKFDMMFKKIDDILNGTFKGNKYYKIKKDKKPKKKRLHKKLNIDIEFPNVRTNIMSDIKQYIINKSGIYSSKNTKIQSHTLDNAIKDVCTSFKSAFTNLRNGNIKHFRIRYIKKTKKRKILKLEQSAFSEGKNTFCPSIMGELVDSYGNHDFSEIKCGGTITYNYKNDQFILYIPIKVEREEPKKQEKEECIAGDGGIKTFLTMYSQDKIVEIAPKLRETISKSFKEIDKINKCEFLTKHKKKLLVDKKTNNIENKIDDMHWKTIKYLTDNYNTILIGNLSTKGIVKKKPVNEIDKMTKRVALKMKFYVFNERLKYKCYLKHCSYKKVNEAFTSKMCTYCGTIKKDLGNKRIYECNHCHKIIERDINGARNIYLTGILKE